MNTILDSGDESIYNLTSTQRGPAGQLPVTAELLAHAPSGDLFGWTQNVGMGLNPKLLGTEGIPHPQHPRRPAQ